MSEQTQLWLTVAGVVVAFPLVAWLFGWSVLGCLSFLDREERFAAAGAVGFAFLGGSYFLGFALHADPRSWIIGTVGVMLLVAVLCRFLRRPAVGAAPWTFAGFFALAYLELVCIQGAFDNYRGGGWSFDWWMHFDEALVFLGLKPITTTWAVGHDYTLASRTPLFNLTTAAVMAAAGHDFAVYQLASALTNSAVVLAIALLSRDFFGRRGALLALLLAPLNLWLLHNAWFTWSKMLAAYFLLLGLHFYVRSVRVRPAQPKDGAGLFLCSWTCLLLGFLTHSVGAVYNAPLVLLAIGMAVFRRAYCPGLGELAAVVLLAGLLIGPWYGWLVAQFGREKVTQTPVTQGNEEVMFTPREIAGWMTYNTLTSIEPLELTDALRKSPEDRTGVYRGLTDLYFSLIPGALTLSLLAFWYIAALLAAHGLVTIQSGRAPPPSATKGELAERSGSDWPAWTAVGLFVVVGWLGAAFLHPAKVDHGIAHAAGFPSVLVLLALGWGLLSRAPRRVIALVVAGIASEFLLMFWSHWWFLTHDPAVLENLPGNAQYKPDPVPVVFLNERIGEAQAVFPIGLAVIQLALIGLCTVAILRPRGASDKAAA
jgi:hypothetical protein